MVQKDIKDIGLNVKCRLKSKFDKQFENFSVHPANCSGWIPINNTKVWECGYDSYIKLGPLKGNNCSTIKLLLDRCTDCNGLLTSCRCEGKRSSFSLPIVLI